MKNIAITSTIYWWDKFLDLGSLEQWSTGWVSTSVTPQWYVVHTGRVRKTWIFTWICCVRLLELFVSRTETTGGGWWRCPWWGCLDLRQQTRPSTTNTRLQPAGHKYQQCRLMYLLGGGWVVGYVFLQELIISPRKLNLQSLYPEDIQNVNKQPP